MNVIDARLEELAGRFDERNAQPAIDSAGIMNVIERELITKALANCKGNKSRTAARLGISRTQLYVRLRKYQLS
jgi:DNA-binding NtrC family response regulator